jgi:hypothetical protein
MDYRYLLYFEREARFDVLEHLAAMAARTSEGPTTLVLPDRAVELPFGTWSEPQRRLTWDDPAPTWDFMTVLCFEPDGPIEDYLVRLRSGPGGQEVSPYDDRGRAELGIVYLTVKNDVDGGTGEDLVLFDFSGPGSTMSVLFWESESIRRSMVNLLESCRGVCGYFDMEDGGELFWLRGERRDDRIPYSEMSLAEMESFVAAAEPEEPEPPPAPLPFSFAAEQVIAAAKHYRRTGQGHELGVNHWLVALHEDDDGPEAVDCRQALAHGGTGSPMSEEQVRERAISHARQAGRTLVAVDDVEAVVREAGKR